MLFIIILKAIPREIRPGSPEELLYTDDLAIVNETLQGLQGRQKAWEVALESNRLRVNVKNTEIVISSENAGKVTEEGKFPGATAKGCRQ